MPKMAEPGVDGPPPLAGVLPSDAVGELAGAVLAGSADAVVVVDAAGTIVLASPAVEGLFGYDPDELVGEPIEHLVPAERRRAHVGHRDRFLAAGEARDMGAGVPLVARCKDGAERQVDVSLRPATAGGAAYVVALVEDATRRRRALRQLEAVNDVTSAILEGASLGATFERITAHARGLLDAAAGWIVTPSSATTLVVTAADGPGTEWLLGNELSAATSRSAAVLATGRIELVEAVSTATNVPEGVRRLDLGPAAYVPLAHPGHAVGVLVVARARGRPGFDPEELELLSLFANQASVALMLGDARRRLERQRLIEEDERIAHELHDRVVRRAFAAGMSLAALRQLTTGRVAERVDGVVAIVDELIRDLRASVFRLGLDARPPAPPSAGDPAERPAARDG